MRHQTQLTSLPTKLTRRSVELQKAFAAGKDFLVQFNYDYCADRYEKYNTPKLALMSGMVKLNEVSKVYNRKTPIIMLKLWLVNLSLFMGFDLPDQQARETGQYIYEEVNMLNLAEITLLFRRIKKGHYGEFYGKFNGQIVLRACREYRSERGRILAKLDEKEQLKLM